MLEDGILNWLFKIFSRKAIYMWTYAVIAFLLIAIIKWKCKIISVYKFSKVGLFLSYVEENLLFHKCSSLKLREIPLSTPFHYIHICSAEVESSESIELKLICDALRQIVPNRSTHHILRYFSFEPSFKLRWCRDRDLFGSQISVVIGEFELRISCKQSSYLIH